MHRLAELVEVGRNYCLNSALKIGMSSVLLRQHLHCTDAGMFESPSQSFYVARQLFYRQKEQDCYALAEAE